MSRTEPVFRHLEATTCQDHEVATQDRCAAMPGTTLGNSLKDAFLAEDHRSNLTKVPQRPPSAATHDDGPDR